MFFARTLAALLKNATDTFPVVLLTGPRQVGKTTLLKHCAANSRHYVTLDDPMERAWFYRDKEKREIDLILEHEGRLHPVEIKRTASPDKRDIRHFAAIDNAGLPRGRGALVCFYEKILPLDETTDTVPFSCLG